MKGLERFKFAPISDADKSEIARIFVEYQKQNDIANLEDEKSNKHEQRANAKRNPPGRKPNAIEAKKRELFCDECGAKVGERCKRVARKGAHHMRGREAHCGQVKCNPCNQKFGLDLVWKQLGNLKS